MTRIKSLMLIKIMYIISYLLGGLAFLLNVDFIVQLFLFDLFATIIIFIFSIIIKNSSLYDPYWSMTPLIMGMICLIKFQNLSILHIILFGCLFIWSARLTINWYLTFKNLKVEDWRYVSYRNRFNPIVFQIVNFFGIQFMPTLLVFLGFIPFIFLCEMTVLNPLIVIGFVIMLLGTNLELISDQNMHAFLRENKSMDVCEKGLWKYSRHPNYLGEISFWIGLYICLLVNDKSSYYLGLGSLLIFLLFEFISIPLMEKKQIQRRVKYQDYRKNTSRLLILPKRNFSD